MRPCFHVRRAASDLHAQVCASGEGRVVEVVPVDCVARRVQVAVEEAKIGSTDGDEDMESCNVPA